MWMAILIKGLVSPRFNLFSVKIFNLDNNFVNHKFEVCTVSLQCSAKHANHREIFSRSERDSAVGTVFGPLF